MEKLRKILVRISKDITQKDEILMREYNQKNLFKIWSKIILNAPTIPSKSWNRIMIALQNVLKSEYPNPITFNGVISKFRKPIRDNKTLDPKIYEQSLILLGRTREDAILQKEAYNAKVSARNSGRMSYPVLYVEDLFNIMDRLINSNDPYDLVLAVELATASRGIEVFKVSKYFAVHGKPNQIKVVGLAKEKMDKNKLKDVVIIRNLVHLTSDQVLDAVRKIRSAFDFTNKTNEKISNLTNASLNKAFRKNITPLFNPQDEGYLKTLSSHKSRYISGYVSYLVYGKPNKIPEESYIGSQLGHLNPESTRSYLGINIQFRNKIISKSPDNIKMLFEREINEIKKKVDICCPDRSQVVDLSEFVNSHRRTMEAEDKINNVVGALKLLKEKNIKMIQRELRGILSYSAKTMTEGYRLARKEGII